MQNGQIRINTIKEDYHDLSDYWTLSMHDNLFGVIPQLGFSYDKKYMFSVGHDGNIFSYKWNLTFEEVYLEEPLDADQIPRVRDIEDPKFLSLEQQKQKDDHDKRMKIANERKEKVLDVLSDYKVEFKEILKLNKQLKESQRVTAKEMELDPRITQDLLDTLEDKMRLVQRKLEFDVEKAKLGGEKIKEFYIDTLESFPIEVNGIVTEKTVKTFRIRKLTDEFYHSCGDLEERIRKELERRR